MDHLELKIDGMTCGHCVSAVTKALKGMEGVNLEQVSVGSATVSYDPEVTSEERITGTVEDQGYAVAAATR